MKKQILITLGLCAVLAVASEWLYFQLTYHEQATNLNACDAVLVYGGAMNRDVQGLKVANRFNIPLFVSDPFGGPEDFQEKIGPAQVLVTVDHFARTTDQNARNAVEFLKKGNYHHALLVTSWFHQPRALFLTRLYLLGSSIDVEPYFFESVPANYWAQSDFWEEMVKFWGSLGRVALASVGIVTGPR
jgi:uncharacterized SAM-binding protein YcdF (DUF218 family)